MQNESKAIGKREQARLAGVAAELRAKEHLLLNGLHFVEQNYSVPLGEIDLIFKDEINNSIFNNLSKSNLIFVEIDQ